MYKKYILHKPCAKI